MGGYANQGKLLKTMKAQNDLQLIFVKSLPWP
jgi:hypothetical protein